MNKIQINNIDILDKTPVLDIKSYIPRIDAQPEARIGWLSEKNFLNPRIYEFKTETEWTEGKKGICRSSSKPDIEIGCPPEFGGAKEYWSPEHLFVAAIDVCIMTTFLWLLKKNNLSIISYKSNAAGKAQLAKKDFVFTEVEIEPVIEIKNDKIKNKIHNLIIEAGNQCMVSKSAKCKVMLHPLIKVIN